MKPAGAIATKKELKFTRVPTPEHYRFLPNGAEQAKKEVAAMTNATLTVLASSTRDHEGNQDYLVYVKCKDGHEFIWEIDGRDVFVFIPSFKQHDPITDLMNMVHRLSKRHFTTE